MVVASRVRRAGIPVLLPSIAASIELAKRDGFRGAADALAILFGLLKIDQKAKAEKKEKRREQDVVKKPQ